MNRLRRVGQDGKKQCAEPFVNSFCMISRPGWMNAGAAYGGGELFVPCDHRIVSCAGRIRIDRLQLEIFMKFVSRMNEPGAKIDSRMMRAGRKRLFIELNARLVL